MNNIITIPHKMIKEKELVLITRRKLEELLLLTKKTITDIVLSPKQKRVLQLGRKNRQSGHFLTLDELKKHVGLAD